jgi:hypothetical protein
MKTFDLLQYDARQGRQETLELQDLLARRPVLKERKDILPFFRKRLHLAVLCGMYNSNILRVDRIAWEYDLFGDLACDLVIGDTVRQAYSFIEFEDAGPKSLFVPQGKRAAREWSRHLDHGYGQIIDWFYKLDDRRNSDDYATRFGKRSIDFMAVLIIGRDQYMDAGERLRLEWRRQHVLVHSKRIHCVTYDELLRDALERSASSRLPPSTA